MIDARKEAVSYKIKKEMMRQRHTTSVVEIEAACDVTFSLIGSRSRMLASPIRSNGRRRIMQKNANYIINVYQSLL